MQTIIAPIDFSPQARNAAVYAAQLAKTFNARLILFHAYMLPTPVSEVPYVMVTVDELQQENENYLKKEAEHLEALYGIQTQRIVRIGIPSDEIKQLAEEENPDLVVMGMKGQGGIDKIIGSTTINAIRKTNSSVLVIPHDAVYAPLNSITFAWDVNDSLNEELAHPLPLIARNYHSDIHIINIEKQQEKDFTAVEKGRLAFDRLFENITHEYITVSDPSVMHGLNSYMERQTSDLLVMIAHKHSFLDRVFSRDRTTEMAHETRIPLLILRHRQ